MGFSSAEVHDHGAPLPPPYLSRHLMSNCLAARDRAHGRLRNSRDALAVKNEKCYLFMDCLTAFFFSASQHMYIQSCVA